LDEAIAADHAVRLLDEILRRLDWQPWEACYHGRIGQPPTIRAFSPACCCTGC
jgi:hypothetical protein